ncbi:MAG: type II toxin-antitoxin system RelE/ParE family toxin [Candidatus Aerophobetes bacterium]|nr:type II toxin-antitoxin system RelE/ParE family toxin [Candidatus Aerophobetes bacterium]
MKEPTYRLRVGEYRIIYRVETQKIIILKIIHRKDLERELKNLT